MIIYQVHPDHGRHMANSLMEAKANEKNGWKTVEEAEFYGQPKVVVPRETNELAENSDISQVESELSGIDENSQEEIPRSVLEELYEAKFGEKPHHRMKDATIKDKLEAE